MDGPAAVNVPLTKARSDARLIPCGTARQRNADLTAQALKNDADLILRRMSAAGGSADMPDRLLRAVSHALACSSHRRHPIGYDEPEIISYAIKPFCPTSADGLQACERCGLGQETFYRAGKGVDTFMANAPTVSHSYR
jgi:hypothetical protein